jgi:hypothetical protein
LTAPPLIIDNNVNSTLHRYQYPAFGNRWRFGVVKQALPPGLAPVEVRLDPESMPGVGDTAIEVLVTEQGCAGGRVMSDALRGPEVIETDTAVLVAFAVVPVAGMNTCEGNPSTAVTIELSEPLGQRCIYDGLFFPPKPLVPAADDVSDDAWQRIDLPEATGSFRSLSIVAIHDAIFLYLTTDEHGTAPDWVFDPVDQSWSELPDDPLGPGFNRLMVWNGVALFLFDKALVESPGGAEYGPNGGTLLADAYIWTP